MCLRRYACVYSCIHTGVCVHIGGCREGEQAQTRLHALPKRVYSCVYIFLYIYIFKITYMNISVCISIDVCIDVWCWCESG